MSFTEFLERLQAHPTSQYIGYSWWFPFLESIHVVAITLVVGSILSIDLRLIGIAGLRYSASRMTRELIPWTWGAFSVATVTGLGMFVTRAPVYIQNPAFQVKLVLLVLACANMALFQFRTFRDIANWDTTAVTPIAAKVAGAASLLLWTGILLAGRWTGHII
jgi:hypothetical protein